MANEIHHRNIDDRGLIELHFESNDVQGAWGKEGRIHYYGTESYLASKFIDWYDARSAGIGKISYRINSNEYMYALVHDFGFEEKRYRGYTTADIFPPSANAFVKVWTRLEKFLKNERFDEEEVKTIQKCFEAGWYE